MSETEEIKLPPPIKTSNKPEIQERVDEQLTRMENDNLHANRGKTNLELGPANKQARNLVARELLRERAQERGETDELTGLKNRRGYEAMMRREVGRAKENTTPLSLLLVDIRGLREFNNKYSLEAGDSLIRQTTKIISDGIRTGDSSARWGGDEIAIIFPNTAVEEAETISNRISETLEQPTELNFLHEGKNSTVKTPIGIRGVITQIDLSDWKASEQHAKEALSELKNKEKEEVVQSQQEPTNVIAKLDTTTQAT